MRILPRNPRAARAAIALLAGLLVGGWVGGGLVWVLNRNKFKDPNTVADVSLTKADEVEMVPADATGFAHVRLADMWKSDAMSEFRKVLEKAGPEAIAALDEGFVPAPSSVDRVTVVMMRSEAAPPPPPPKATAPKGETPFPKFDIPPPPSTPKILAILAFKAPFDAATVVKANKLAADAKKHNGKEYWVDDAGRIAVHFPTDRLIVIGTESSVKSFLSQESKKDGPLTPAIKLAASGSRHLVAAVNMSQIRDFPIPLPDEVAPILRADSMTLGVVVGGSGGKVDLRASYKDDAAAQDAERSLRAAAETGRKKLAEVKTQMETAVKGKPGAAKPRPIEDLPGAVGGLFALGAVNMLDEWLADPPLKREGNEIVAAITMNSMGSAYASMSAMSIGMLLPAVQKVREAAARSSDANNLKQIGLAFHNYASANQDRFPEQSWGNKVVNGRMTGKLSWRVALLPFIEQDQLYRQFKLDEPWDSEHNKKLIPLMPKTYATPLAPAEPGRTYYKVFVGKGAMFNRPFNKYQIFNIPDGSSNTILVAEGGDPVTWTKPEDFEFDPSKPLPKIAMPGKNGFNVLMADGSVRFVSASVSETTLKNAIQADDGNVLGEDW